MSDFGDFDPEDAWDDADPVHIRLALLARIVLSIDADSNPARAARRRIEIIRLLRKIADELAA